MDARMKSSSLWGPGCRLKGWGVINWGFGNAIFFDDGASAIRLCSASRRRCDNVSVEHGVLWGDGACRPHAMAYRCLRRRRRGGRIGYAVAGGHEPRWHGEGWGLELQPRPLYYVAFHDYFSGRANETSGSSAFQESANRSATFSERADGRS